MLNLDNFSSDITVIPELIGNRYNVYIHGDELHFKSIDGSLSWRFFHAQDCCENVDIDGVEGDLSVLNNSPIIRAYEVSNVDLPPRHDSDNSYTWTFYKFATEKGEVTVRFFGSSNGYYSEEMSFGVLDI